jgi:hypothetical protein
MFKKYAYCFKEKQQQKPLVFKRDNIKEFLIRRIKNIVKYRNHTMKNTKWLSSIV